MLWTTLNISQRIKWKSTNTLHLWIKWRLSLFSAPEMFFCFLKIFLGWLWKVEIGTQKGTVYICQLISLLIITLILFVFCVRRFFWSYLLLSLFLNEGLNFPQELLGKRVAYKFALKGRSWCNKLSHWWNFWIQECWKFYHWLICCKSDLRIKRFRFL